MLSVRCRWCTVFLVTTFLLFSEQLASRGRVELLEEPCRPLMWLVGYEGAVAIGGNTVVLV